MRADGPRETRHLLIGLLDEGHNLGIRLLQALDVDAASARRAVTSAISGFTHARETSATADTSKLDEIVRRLVLSSVASGPQGSDGWRPSLHPVVLNGERRSAHIVAATRASLGVHAVWHTPRHDRSRP
jgi:ATP-dependent Clp protease ATP-binding subunit ClpA